MRKLLAISLLMAVVFTGCGPKPQFQTAKGKRKIKHYNSIQYDQPKWNSKKGKGTF